jgi:hypothetical protein
MIEALKAWRLEIIDLLKPAPVREWLWRLGHRYTADAHSPADWHPTGAWWFRLQGETEWKPVPGRNPDNLPLPEDAK